MWRTSGPDYDTLPHYFLGERTSRRQEASSVTEDDAPGGSSRQDHAKAASHSNPPAAPLDAPR